jgi:predicted nucleic acid-binding protein
MKYLLDTCVVSELIRLHPDPRVIAWLSGQPEQNIFLSTITLGEIKKGIERLSAGPKRESLEAWLRQLESRFSLRTICIGVDEAYAWGILSAQANQAGMVLPVADGLMAACARAHALVLATRNTPDFKTTGIPVLNPWQI